MDQIQDRIAIRTDSGWPNVQAEARSRGRINMDSSFSQKQKKSCFIAHRAPPKRKKIFSEDQRLSSSLIYCRRLSERACSRLMHPAPHSNDAPYPNPFLCSAGYPDLPMWPKQRTAPAADATRKNDLLGPNDLDHSHDDPDDPRAFHSVAVPAVKTGCVRYRVLKIFYGPTVSCSIDPFY